MTTYLQSRPAREIRPGWLWFGMLGGPVAWFTFLVVVWALVEFGCRLNVTAYLIFGYPAMHVVIIISAVIAGLVAAAAGARALISTREIGDGEREGLDAAGRRMAFMARVGTYLSVVFLVLIVVSIIPAFFLPACGGTGA